MSALWRDAPNLYRQQFLIKTTKQKPYLFIKKKVKNNVPGELMDFDNNTWYVFILSPLFINIYSTIR